MSKRFFWAFSYLNAFKLLWFEGISTLKYVNISIVLKGAILHTMHTISLFSSFTSITIVLEKLMLNLLCMQKFPNILVRFCTYSTIIRKNTISSTYNKQIITSFLIVICSMPFFFTSSLTTCRERERERMFVSKK